MVFDPSVYETASVATETYNPIISDEEWDSDMESDFDMLHQVHMLELMGYDVWLTRENLQEELESVFNIFEPTRFYVTSKIIGGKNYLIIALD